MLLRRSMILCLLGGPGLQGFQTYANGELKDAGAFRSEAAPFIERFTVDRGALTRKYPIEMSAVRRQRMNEFYNEWLRSVAGMDFEHLTQAGRIDYLLFKNYLDRQNRQLDLQAKALEEAKSLLPFAAGIVTLDENCRQMEPVDGAQAAKSLDEIKKQIAAVRKDVEASLKTNPPKSTIGLRAALAATGLKSTLKHWFDFYNGYDPLFTWWAAEPYKATDAALEDYAKFLRETVAGEKRSAKESIAGNPIGRDGLMSELAGEMIPYTPEELIALAHKEFAWCENEMKRASRELGYGDEWMKALEHVKTLHVPPGKQPDLIRQLALEAESYLDEHDLVTIPKLARESWRMEMMSPERQLVNPFFTGGEVISVSFPVGAMTEEQKLMSLRGNNIHFSRATVFHELIPGHHLQLFMNERYRPYRRVFGTPFSIEGWALYWELLLWDMGFPKTPENRIGMLFWRMHRCARIIFSLNFHLEKMTAQECVDFLVNRVGHERDNAEGEVRRSFNGSYPPLYQAAYLLGGMQIYSLRRELVGQGKMTDRQFHDAILRENSIPIEMLRAALTNQTLSKDFISNWRFADR